MLNTIYTSHKSQWISFFGYKSKSNDHIPFNNLALYNKLSYTHQSICLVMLLISGVFNFRVGSSFYNFYNLHKQDKVAGLRLLRASTHIACTYSLTEPN